MTVKMLFVDDEPKFKLVVKQLFRNEIRSGKFEVLFALNGVEALALLEKEPDTELLLTDINMPKMNGLKLLSEISGKKHLLNPCLTSLVISAYSDMENIRKAMNAGAFDFLTKPLDLKDLEITLNKAIDHVERLKSVKQREQAAETAMRKAEAIALSAERFRKMFTNHSAPMILLDPETALVVEANRAASNFYGYSQDEFRGLEVAKLHTSVYEHVRDAIADVIAGGRNYFVFEHRLKYGSVRNVEIYSAPIEVENRTLLFSVIHDITERIRAEKNLENAMKLAESANRTKSEFLANMSHEIRTPMNAILGFCELLLERTEDPQDKNYLKSIYKSGRSLLRIIDDILDLTKIEAGKLELQPEPTHIRSLLKEVKNIFSQKAREKAIEFVVHIAESPSETMMLDEIRVKQVLFNLVSNAIKFTSTGRIDVRARVRAEPPLSANENRRETAELTIEVEDTGIGIPPDQNEIIFESFRQREGQKNREYGGTGLGLTITRKLVDMMNGKILLKSRLGRGSIFKAVIPRVEILEKSEAVGLSQDISRDAHPAFEPAEIMVVDDFEINRVLVKEYLKETPISVIEASDGEQALDMIQKKIPALVFMDLKLPGKNGYEITEIIKKTKSLKNVPVIALSASAMESANSKIEALFDSYLMKPITRKKLFDELQKFLPAEGNRAGFVAAASVEPRPCPTQVGLTEPPSPDILHILEKQTLPKWEEIREIFYIDEVADFAGELNRIALAYPFAPLEEYSRALHEHTQNNDIDEIEKILAKFPSILEQIKNTFQPAEERSI